MNAEEIRHLRAEHQEHPNTQTIHTAEELQQLPEGTVIRSELGRIWEKICDNWYTPGFRTPLTEGLLAFAAPARVIWTPEGGTQQ